MLVEASAPEMIRGNYVEGRWTAQVLGKAHVSYVMQRWFPGRASTDEAQREPEPASMREVLSFFARFNADRVAGRMHDGALPRVHPESLLTHARHELRLAAHGLDDQVREVTRGMYKAPFPGVEWKIQTTDDGLIWAETVQGGDMAVVKIMEEQGPTGWDLDDVLVCASAWWEGEPDGLDWAGSRTAEWRNLHFPETHSTRGPRGVTAELNAELFNERLVNVGPAFELDGNHRTQFRYNPTTQELLAFRFLANEANPLAELSSADAPVVAHIAPADADRIVQLELSPSSGQEGIEKVLNAALRSQIGVPPLDHGRPLDNGSIDL